MLSHFAYISAPLYHTEMFLYSRQSYVSHCSNEIQGVSKTTISTTIKMLEGWNIFYLKGGIHGSVLSTKTFLYDIRELRYKQIKIGY